MVRTILLIILTALFLQPCSDSKNCCQDSDARTYQENHNHAQDNDDSCSPFCQCICCNISVVTFYSNFPKLISPTQILVTKIVVTKDVSFVSKYQENIWQPPKIKV